jgi:SAM-dependent methyltransferase
VPGVDSRLIRALRRNARRARRAIRFRSGDYLAAYRADTDQQVQVDPHSAPGGMWEDIGRLQFDYLVGRGLQPGHSMLDIGCGTLRGGRHFIGYLEPGRYTGMDISSAAIEFAGELVEKEGLADRRPELVVSWNMDLTFREFEGRTFDWLLAQSVFTHLKPPHIEECFAHVGTVMHDDSSFYFTWAEAERYTERTVKDFSYPFSFFEELAQRFGLRVERLDDYDHPRGQRMTRLTRVPRT